MTMKMRLNMKNRSQRNEINRAMRRHDTNILNINYVSV